MINVLIFSIMKMKYESVSLYIANPDLLREFTEKKYYNFTFNSSQFSCNTVSKYLVA